MNLTPFRNSLDETLEQGEVVVIGRRQALLRHKTSEDMLFPEVELAQSAYDTRVCGIVSHLHVEPQMERYKTSKDTVPTTKKVVKAATPKSVEKSGISREPERTKVQPGQIGYMVTQGAFAHCKVDADIAAIQVGDLLTTSPTKGHAQKVLDSSKVAGAILGKALGSLKKGKGEIPVLVVS